MKGKYKTMETWVIGEMMGCYALHPSHPVWSGKGGGGIGDSSLQEHRSKQARNNIKLIRKCNHHLNVNTECHLNYQGKV